MQTTKAFKNLLKDQSENKVMNQSTNLQVQNLEVVQLFRQDRMNKYLNLHSRISTELSVFRKKGI
jgi:hypothetical protein